MDPIRTLPDATSKYVPLPSRRTIGAAPAKPYGAQPRKASIAEQAADALTGGAYSRGQRFAEQVHQGAYADAAKTLGKQAALTALSHPAVSEAVGGLASRAARAVGSSADAAPASSYSLPDLPPESQRGPYDQQSTLERVMKSGPIFDPEEAAEARAKAPGIAADSVAGRAATSADMLKNMQESGFAGGVPNTGVVLPTSGAGRSGTTTAAMAAARQSVDPNQFRTMVNAEIARRGGATSPEVTMAATEQVARNLASQPPTVSYQPQNY